MVVFTLRLRVKWHVGDVEMPEKIAVYRLHAAGCTELAQQSTDPKQRLVFLNMANAWSALSELAEKRVVQQQQQPQHKDCC